MITYPAEIVSGTVALFARTPRVLAVTVGGDFESSPLPYRSLPFECECGETVYIRLDVLADVYDDREHDCPLSDDGDVEAMAEIADEIESGTYTWGHDSAREHTPGKDYFKRF